MGQRLNIEIVNGETSLANCYYHWSAYTGSALNLTKHIIDSYYDSEAIVGLKMAIELLEATGGGVNETERAEIQKQPKKFGSFEFKDCTNRNNGLISEKRRPESGKKVVLPSTLGLKLSSLMSHGLICPKNILRNIAMKKTFSSKILRSASTTWMLCRLRILKI